MDPGIRARSSLDSACRITRRLIAENPIKPDHSGEYEALQAWPFVTALYSGMEQALKMLLMMPADSTFALQVLRSRDWGHNLTKLHAALPEEDVEHIELHFREHWSLFELEQFAPGIKAAQDFISHVNGVAQEGSLMWRYNLLDPAIEKPSTNLWTMSEIWHAACCCIRARALDRHGSCFRASKRLMHRFQRCFLDTPVPYADYITHYNNWANQRGSQLAAWVDLLVKSSRGHIDQAQASEALCPELDKLAKQAFENMSRDTADPDEQMLLQRVRRTDRDLEWDPRRAEFRWAGKATR